MVNIVQARLPYSNGEGFTMHMNNLTSKSKTQSSQLCGGYSQILLGNLSYSCYENLAPLCSTSSFMITFKYFLSEIIQYTKLTYHGTLMRVA